MELDHWLLPAQGNKENTRFQNTNKLREIFRSTPEMPASCVALRVWRELGPFDFEKAIEQNNLSFDGNIAVTQELRFERGLYFGQVPKQIDSLCIGRKIYTCSH